MKFTITTEDARDGKMLVSNNCAVARSIKRTTGKHNSQIGVIPGGYTVTGAVQFDGPFGNLYPDNWIGNLARLYDAGFDVSGATFEIPDEFIPVGV